MKKRLLSFALAIAIIISLCTNAFALSTYTIPEGTTVLEQVPLDYEVLVIPGDVLVISDSESSYSTGSYPLQYVSIGNGVQYIGRNSFSGASIQSVTIPNSVTYIGENAFPSVTKVILKSGAAKSFFDESNGTILGTAFPAATTLVIDGNYSDFTTIELDNITFKFSQYLPEASIIFNDKTIVANNYLAEGSVTIPDCAYYGSIYESLIFPESIKTIGSLAFANSPHLSYIDLSNTQVIGERAFYDCIALSSVTIPATVTSIGTEAFNTVQTVTFESGSSLIEMSHDIRYAFPSVSTIYVNTPYSTELSWLTEIGNVTVIIFGDGSVWERDKLFFPLSSSTIEAEAYAYQNYTFESIVIIPDHITTIGEGAFKYSTNANGISLVLGNNVADIKASAFENSSVNSIIFGSAPISIGEYAFQNTAITSLRIPSNVVSLGTNAFNTDTLNALVIDASVLTGALSERSITDVFGAVNNIIIEGDLTEISPHIFSYTGATNISYSDKVVSIGAYAFYYCCITQANIGDSVMSIGECAYRNSHITSLNIPDSVVCVGADAFADCNSLLYAKIGSGLTEIPSGMLSGCSSLKTAMLPETITTIGPNAFNGCSALTNINIPFTVTEIGANAFEGCTSLQSVVIPSGVTTIRAGAFKNCTGLKSIEIPDSVTTIEEGAFEGCTALEGVVIPTTVKEIQTSAFKNCSTLATVVVPENVEVVADDAFEGCDNITLAGTAETAIEDYALFNSVPFYAVNAYPCQGTEFDFNNNVIYTENTVCSIDQIIKSATNADIVYSDTFCGTGSTVTITTENDTQTYTLVVDGDINGDSACDVLDSHLASLFSNEIETPSSAQIYAAGGKDAEEISVAEYSRIVNKSIA